MDGDVKKFKIKKTTDDYTEWNPEFTVEKELKRTNSGFPYHVSIIQDWDGTCDDPEYYFRLVPVHECFYGSDFLPVEVEGGVGNFTWSIVGDGFSLTTETTSARTNAVSTDDTVELNDEATLTVEDSCGTIITTKLRACPYGSDDTPIHDDCTGVTMGVETLTPGFGFTQTLTAVGAQDGVTYYWFMAGEGSLSAQEGNSVTYTAGSTTGIGFVILSGGVEHHNCAQNTFVAHVCDCTGVSIDYTTQQMAVDEEQTLSVTDAVSGCTYRWAISYGGGELSTVTGTVTTYTAPSTNANCTNNATITLSVYGEGQFYQCDTLQIAVNAYRATDYAYEVVSLDAEPSECCSYAPFSCGPPPNYPPCPAVQYCGPKTEYTCKIYGCTGEMLRWCGSYFCHMTIPHDNYPGSIGCYTYAGNQRCGYGKVWGTYDLRSDAKKAGGCCPSALL